MYSEGWLWQVLAGVNLNTLVMAIFTVHKCCVGRGIRSLSPCHGQKLACAFILNLFIAWIFLQVDRLFSDLQLLEADLMDTMNDHIRLVNFGFGGNPETIYPHLR